MPRLQDFIWFEKYRPTELKNLALNKEHRKAFTHFIEAGEVPHLLLEGPQGSGKTTVAHILTNSIPCTRIVLNASGKERGIETITGRVKQFAGSKSPKGHIKVVFMDEADALTPQAQTALRNTMETYSKNCRFILTCNYVDKIIAPIQSRCMKFTFNQFPKRKLLSLCENILDSEGIEGYDPIFVSDLMDKFGSDIRSIIQSLQSACLSGTFNAKALSSLVVDPVKVCESISEGAMLSLRTQIAGVTDFTYLYRYMIDHYVPLQEGNDEVIILMGIAILQAIRAENTVPDREINFTGCALELMDAMEISPSFLR